MNKITAIILAIMVLIGLSVGMIVPALISTKIIPFFFILLILAIYAWVAFVMLRFLIKEFYREWMKIIDSNLKGK